LEELLLATAAALEELLLCAAWPLKSVVEDLELDKL
jgi:hypothetical protein